MFRDSARRLGPWLVTGFRELGLPHPRELRRRAGRPGATTRPPRAIRPSHHGSRPMSSCRPRIKPARTSRASGNDSKTASSASRDRSLSRPLAGRAQKSIRMTTRRFVGALTWWNPASANMLRLPTCSSPQVTSCPACVSIG